MCRIEKFLYNAEPRRAKQTGGAAYLESKMIILLDKEGKGAILSWNSTKNNNVDEKNKQKVPVVDVASRAARCVRSKV